MLLFTIIKRLLALRLSRQKTNFFWSFRVNLALLSMFRGYNIGWKRHPEDEQNTRGDH